MKGVSKIAAGAIRKLGLRDPLLRMTSSQFRRHQAVLDDVLSRIDSTAFDAVRASFSPDAVGYKYLDIQEHGEEMVGEVDRLGMLEASPMRVLDLGSGSGMYLHVLRCVGHDVMGLDLDEVPVYNAMIELLDIPRVVHRIERYQPLPDFGDPFDLITAFSIMFDCHGLDIDQPVWMPAEWKFFLDDCLSRLNPGGRMVILFNPATQCDFDFMPDEVEDFLRALPGVTLSQSKENFTITRPAE